MVTLLTVIQHLSSQLISLQLLACEFRKSVRESFITGLYLYQSVQLIFHCSWIFLTDQQANYNCDSSVRITDFVRTVSLFWNCFHWSHLQNCFRYASALFAF